MTSEASADVMVIGQDEVVGPREQLAQCLEHVLAASLGDEPVMDEGDLHGAAL